MTAYPTDFNQGDNQLPQAGAALTLGEYDQSIILKTGEVDSEINAVYEIDSFDESINQYTVKRPTGDGVANAQLIFGAAHLASSDDEISGAFNVDKPLWVAFDTVNGTPVLGDDVGTLTDSYKMAKGNAGFKCLDFNAAEGLCLVRPFSTSLMVFNKLGDIPSASVTGDTVGPWLTLAETFDLTAGAWLLGLGGSTAAFFESWGLNFVATASDWSSVTTDLQLSIELAEADNTIIHSVTIMKIGNLAAVGSGSIIAFAHSDPSINYMGYAGADKTIATARFKVNSASLSSWSIASSGVATMELGILSGNKTSYIEFQ